MKNLLKNLNNLFSVFALGGGGLTLSISSIFKNFINKNVYYPTQIRNNGASVFDYFFLMSLNEKDYPKYLKQAFYIKFGKKLNLNHPKDINEKIQWLKIYDNKAIKQQLTDKYLVRNYVKEKIGEDFLKPILQVCNKFDEINFEILPESFVVKCNHGCKWHFFVKNKYNYLNNKKFLNFTKDITDGWISQSFFGWSDFETQYKDIQPKIIIEELLRENKNESPAEIEVWCFNSSPEIIQKSKTNTDSQKIVSIFDKNHNQLNLKFDKNNVIEQSPFDENLNLAAELSTKLADNFKLVRVDWILYKNKLYFNEMTFTPYSGFILFDKEYEDWYIKLGNMLNLKGN